MPCCVVLWPLQVDLWLGDACSKLPEVFGVKGRGIDLLLLDGLPKETLAYLKAAEPYLTPGAVVIADNAGGWWGLFVIEWMSHVAASCCFVMSLALCRQCVHSTGVCLNTLLWTLHTKAVVAEHVRAVKVSNSLLAV